MPPDRAKPDPLSALAARLAERSGVRFTIAETESDRNSCYRLRRRAVHEQSWSTDDSDLEHDAFDASAIHIAGWQGREIVACGRLVLPPGPLPTEVACDITVAPAGAVVDVGRMTVAAEARQADRTIFLALLAALYLETRRHGYTTGCGMMAPNVRALLRHLGVRLDVLGPDRLYWHELRAPVRFDVEMHGGGVIERWA